MSPGGLTEPLAFQLQWEPLTTQQQWQEPCPTFSCDIPVINSSANIFADCIPDENACGDDLTLCNDNSVSSTKSDVDLLVSLLAATTNDESFTGLLRSLSSREISCPSLPQSPYSSTFLPQGTSPATTASSSASCPPLLDDEDDDTLRTVDIAVSGARRSIVLAHPDEFKNPSSFLKIYGDPLCSGPSSMPRKGQQGNWECSVCSNVNFPRRFRCHKCSALRGPAGDLIVSDYACVVYNQLNASIRRNIFPHNESLVKGDDYRQKTNFAPASKSSGNTNNASPSTNNVNYPNTKGLIQGIGMNKTSNLAFADPNRKANNQFSKPQQYYNENSLMRRSAPHVQQRPSGLSSSNPLPAPYRPYLAQTYTGSLKDARQTYLRSGQSGGLPHQWSKTSVKTDFSSSPELFLSSDSEAISFARRLVSRSHEEIAWPMAPNPQ